MSVGVLAISSPIFIFYLNSNFVLYGLHGTKPFALVNGLSSKPADTCVELNI